MENPTLFGLIGRNIAYSFSAGYFTEKFERMNLNCQYQNFDLDDISEFPKILTKNPKGLNVTIPYKESIIPFLDELSATAQKIGAVNTIAFKHGRLVGHNTDYFGFQKSLEAILKPDHKKALILGTGGASKAIAFALGNLGIDFTAVSRNPRGSEISYQDIDQAVFGLHQLVINTTPVGTSPDTDGFPLIPYQYFTPEHIAYDLIYNPAETQFLKHAKKHGAVTINGLKMLELQAEKAWEIWNS